MIETTELKARTSHFFLPNGLKTICHEDHTNRILCIQLMIKTGSIHESDMERGYCHFVEHLAFKSTQSYNTFEISDIIPSLGGTLNAYTDFDSTCYYLIIPSEHIGIALHVLAEIVFRTTFTALDVKTERDIIIEEIKGYDNEPDIEFFEFIQNAHFSQNPMKYPILGSVKSVREATYDRLQSFYRAHYHSNNATLVISGDYDPKIIEQMVLDEFKDIPSNGLNKADLSRFIEPEPCSFTCQTRVKKNSSLFLAILLPELTESHPEANALLIAMRFLAIGKASRLYKRLVETEKICTNVKVSSLSGTLSGASLISFHPTGHHQIPQIVHILKQEVTRIIDRLPSNAEWDLVMCDVIHGYMHSFDTMESITGMIASEDLIGDYQTLFSYTNEIMNTSPKQVQESVRKYWKIDKLSVYIQAPYPLQKSLLKSIQETPNSRSILDKIDTCIAMPSESHSYQYDNLINGKMIFVSDKEHLYSYTCSSGLRIYFKQSRGKKVCGLALSGNISQLCEDKQHRSINYLCSTSLLYSSQFRTYENIQVLSRKHGFSLRSSHNIDSTSIKAKFFNDSLSLVLELLSEILLFPGFEQKHISLIKAATIDSIRREAHHQFSKAYRRWQKMLFGNDNNIEANSSTIQSIRQVSRQQILGWHQSQNIPQQYALCIVGDEEPEKVFSLCERFFGAPFSHLPSQNILPKPRFQVSNPRMIVSSSANPQAVINLGGFGCPAHEVKHTTAFYLLTQILGGDINSRMFTLLREKHGLAYQTGFDFTSLPQLGYWNALIMCDADKALHTLDLTQKIIFELVRDGVTTKELETAQNFLVGSGRIDFENSTWLASTISILIALGYDINHFLDREARIRKINLDDIQEVASRWLSSQPYTYILK